MSKYTVKSRLKKWLRVNESKSVKVLQNYLTKLFVSSTLKVDLSNSKATAGATPKTQRKSQRSSLLFKSLSLSIQNLKLSSLTGLLPLERRPVMNAKNIGGLLAALSLVTVLAGCGSGGGDSEPEPATDEKAKAQSAAPVAQVFTGTASGTCFGGAVKTASATSGVSQADASTKATTALALLYPSSCTAPALTLAVSHDSKGVCTVSGFPNDLTIKSFTGTFPSGSEIVPVTMDPVTRVLTCEGRYNATVNATMKATFSNAPDMVVNLTYTHPKWEIATIKAPIADAGAVITAEPVFSEVALSTKFDQQPWKDFVTSITQGGVWFRSLAVVKGRSNVLMVGYRTGSFHCTAQFDGDTGEYIGKSDGHVGSAICTGYKPVNRVGTVQGLGLRFVEEGGICMSFMPTTPTSSTWESAQLEACPANF